MEHIVFHSIMDQNNILNSHQHGFRPKYSCQSQLVLLTKEIFKAMDQQKQTVIRLFQSFQLSSTQTLITENIALWNTRKPL